jgi:hypothetical protein
MAASLARNYLAKAEGQVRNDFIKSELEALSDHSTKIANGLQVAAEGWYSGGAGVAGDGATGKVVLGSRMHNQTPLTAELKCIKDGVSYGARH